MKKQIFVIIIFILWFSLLSYSHGLTLKVEKQSPFVMVTSMYHGGSALTDAEVKVFFNDTQIEFQKGRVDKNGKFSFVPDRKGDWFFRVDDGMGHRKTVKIAVDTDFFTEKPAGRAPISEPGLPDGGKKSSEGTRGVCIYCKILLGVVLIFAFTLILYARKKKGESRR